MRLPLPLPKKAPVERPCLPLVAPRPPMPMPETKKPTEEHDPKVDFRIDLFV